MKKYRLTDQRTLLGILAKLANASFTDPVSQSKYKIVNPSIVTDINKSVHVTLEPQSGTMGKPAVVLSILKENKIELKIKQANPYQDDLFILIEASIEPLERSSKRANIDNISALNLKSAAMVDIGTILSLHGKTSLINQLLKHWQVNLEQVLLNYGYFIRKASIGFFYAVDNPLMEELNQSKLSFFLRDATKSNFFSEHGFFNPKKMGEQYIRSMLDNYLVNNIKSILIVPIFSYGEILLGYFELTSNMPDLGNEGLHSDIMGPSGIAPLNYFLGNKAEEFVFQMEFSYAKDWKEIVSQARIRDISQDGRGIGLYISNKLPVGDLVPGIPISFQILINEQPYSFFGSLRGIKPSTSGTDHILGIRVYHCDKQEGLELLSRFASQLIGSDLVT